MNGRRQSNRRRKRGYMLIETIVALAIFSITLVAIYSANSQSVRSLRKSENIAELQLLMPIGTQSPDHFAESSAWSD